MKFSALTSKLIATITVGSLMAIPALSLAADRDHDSDNGHSQHQDKNKDRSDSRTSDRNRGGRDSGRSSSDRGRDSGRSNDRGRDTSRSNDRTRDSRDSRDRNVDRDRDRDRDWDRDRNSGRYNGGRYEDVRYYDNHRSEERNEWRDIALVAGGIALLGVLEHDRTLVFVGEAGALYSLYRYEDDLHSSDRECRLRAEYFSRPYFIRDGRRYDRVLVTRHGERYYQFVCR